MARSSDKRTRRNRRARSRAEKLQTKPTSSDAPDSTRTGSHRIDGAKLADPISERRLAIEPAPSSSPAPSAPLAVLSEATTPAVDFELDFEDRFFAQGDPGDDLVARAVPLEEEASDLESEPRYLTPAQHSRRLWLRRQVVRLMAGLTAFTLVATIIHVASAG